MFHIKHSIWVIIPYAKGAEGEQRRAWRSMGEQMSKRALARGEASSLGNISIHSKPCWKWTLNVEGRSFFFFS